MSPLSANFNSNKNSLCHILKFVNAHKKDTHKKVTVHASLCHSRALPVRSSERRRECGDPEYCLLILDSHLRGNDRLMLFVIQRYYANSYSFWFIDTQIAAYFLCQKRVYFFVSRNCGCMICFRIKKYRVFGAFSRQRATMF